MHVHGGKKVFRCTMAPLGRAAVVGMTLETSARLRFHLSLELRLVEVKEQVRPQLLKGSLQTFHKHKLRAS